ncbi:hypothetical protein ACC689_11840 [Rhizobium ruizarguesonis]
MGFSVDWYYLSSPLRDCLDSNRRKLNGVRTGHSVAFKEHDAEKCKRFSDDIMLSFFDLDPDDHPDLELTLS